ncbi:MAG: hypothetical protein L6V93_14945 [Clostridiales bacterium]|nr:MAG: hypothetical protein L6V93_14945 [Clostridiales bacterium]
MPVNGIPDGIKSGGEKARVLNSAYGGRVLQVIKGAKTTVTVPLKTDEQKYYIDFKIGAENKANANISVANNGTVYNILKIEDNEIKTKRGQRLFRALPQTQKLKNNTFYGGLTQISIAVNLKSGTYSAYVNRRLCVDDWKIFGAVKPDSFIIEKNRRTAKTIFILTTLRFMRAAFRGSRRVSKRQLCAERRIKRRKRRGVFLVYRRYRRFHVFSQHMGRTDEIC